MTQPISTGDSLRAQYGNKKIVQANIIIKDFLGLGDEEKPLSTKDITQLMAKDKLEGIKPFRLGSGRTCAPYFVDVYQVAEVIDNRARG